MLTGSCRRFACSAKDGLLIVASACSHGLCTIGHIATFTPSGATRCSPVMYVSIASLSAPNLLRASSISVAEASCTAAVSIFTAGAPSVAAVAMLPALA